MFCVCWDIVYHVSHFENEVYMNYFDFEDAFRILVLGCILRLKQRARYV